MQKMEQIQLKIVMTSTINLERVNSAAITVTFRRNVPPKSSDSNLRDAKFFRRILNRLMVRIMSPEDLKGDLFLPQ